MTIHYRVLLPQAGSYLYPAVPLAIIKRTVHIYSHHKVDWIGLGRYITSVSRECGVLHTRFWVPCDFVQGM